MTALACLSLFLDRRRRRFLSTTDAASSAVEHGVQRRDATCCDGGHFLNPRRTLTLNSLVSMKTNLIELLTRVRALCSTDLSN